MKYYPRRLPGKTVFSLLLVAGVLTLTSAWVSKEWKEFKDCKLIKNESNDGDSFHVKHKTNHYIFRLYFVDTPETDERFMERVAEQAAYFGVDSKAAIKLGEEAADFTREQLKDGFTVYTRYHNAQGASDRKRYYAMIKVGDKYLSELLVENGYARIFGLPCELPGGKVSQRNYSWRLDKLQKDARKLKKGGWAKGKPGAAPAPAAGQPVPRKPGYYVLRKNTPVYSLDQEDLLLGSLRPGTSIQVMDITSNGLHRVRFRLPDGRKIQGGCKPDELITF